MKRRGLYVETTIRAPIEAVWTHTQTPALHERWDLRFSTIDYLPRSDAAAPQQFTYETRLGLGLSVAGIGESVGEQTRPDGSRTSSLTFASDSPLAIIRRGSGYWKYVPTADGVRFLTWYDYDTRWGHAGYIVDRCFFRPLIGWATAWSFDRLRLWLERGLPPEIAVRSALTHGLARVTLAFALAYHGLVPKLLGPHADEIAMMREAGVERAHAAVMALGVCEVAAALLLLGAWRARWPLWCCMAAMAAATVGVALTSPRFLQAAFNPVSLNVAVTSLAAVALLAGHHVPSGARCRRTPLESH